MKSSKGFISFLLALTMSLGTAVALTSCGSKKKDDSSSNQTQQFDDLGEYYCIVGESEWSLNVTGDQFILTVNGQAKNGEYTFDGETLSVKFTDGALATATVDSGVMTLDYDRATYKLYKKVNYTVTFETNDGSAVESGKVINGQSVAKPADPTKDGFVFIGWYEDSTFKTPYVFAKPVTSDMTLYARFVKSPTNPAEFTVKFVVDGNEAFEALTTKDGVIYNTELPTPEKEGATFVGWWMSDFEDANKLTAKYTEQVLGEHTTLYAVWADDKANVSVSDKEITWTAAGVNNSYKVVVKNAAGEELLSRNTSTPKVAFDFAQQPAGEYTVEVSFSGKTTTAYYNNKALDKVCIFAVTDSTVTFNAVANAKKYLITVDCANDEHQHTDLDIGTSTYYNFDACDMQVGGIKFTVKAVADGYTTSTSETFSVERTLNQVTDLTVDNATETATWSAVENATAYAIKIENAGNVIEKTITETSYSLKGMTGEIIVSVYPMGKGFNPAAAASYTYNNVRLAVPSGLKLAGQSLAWDAVAGAAKYNVKIGANVFEAATNSLALTDAHFPDGLDTYAVSVQAIASEAEKNSLYSDEITINCNKMSDTVAYSNGSIVWDYVLGASKYGVKVNDGEEIFVDGASNTCAITLTQAGENTIYVRSYDATNEATDWVSVKVSANTITFVTEGEAVAPMYKVNGDTYELTVEATRDGYNFVGWYDIANGPENNGTRITEGVMNGDVTVYAGWTSKEYKVNFDLGEYGEMTETEASVYYAKDYELPTPTVEDSKKAFAGWYTQPNGEGFQYTRYTGASLTSWKDLDGRTLYAHYVDIFTFTLNEDDDNKSYSIAKGDGIDMVSKITIPASYEGKPVTRLDAEAFARSTSITEINIPDSVTTITIPNGGTGTGSAFYTCNNLQNVNVYCACAEGEHRKSESRYASVDGILYENKEYGGMSVVYVPHARTGSLTLPSKIKMLSGEEIALATIPTNAFRNIKISEIVIPATVTKIETNAFYATGTGYSLLESIVFAPAAEGEEELPLEIMKEAFDGQANLTTLSLPARLKDFNVNMLEGLDSLLNIDITGTVANAQYASVEGMLTNAAKTEILYVPRARTGAFTINTTSINTIGAYALEDCDGITSIVIPAHITEIKEGAFYDCDGVTELIFEGTAEEATLNIRKKAFYGLGNGGTTSSLLKTINLPANVGAVESNAFGNTGYSTEGKLLTVNVAAGGSGFEDGAFGSDAKNPSFYVGSVNIGKNVDAFSIPGVFGSANLKKVDVDSENQHYTSVYFKEYDATVVYDKNVTMIAYFPAGISEYTVPSTVTSIGASVFQGKKDLTKVTIPASVASIGNQAFSGCTNLTQVIFSDEGTAADVLTIGTSAFSSTKITSINLPERLTTIGDSAFSSTKLTAINIPKNVTKIGATADLINVFDSITTLTAITVDAANTAYMDINGILYEKNADGKPSALCFAPQACALTNGTLDVQKSVAKFYKRAFYYNDTVTTITFSEGSEGSITFGTEAFYYSVVANIDLPEGLTTIAEKMFQNATTLKKINIPTTVTTIENQAFYYCTALEEVTFSDRSNCTTTLTISDVTKTSSQWLYSPFYHCSSLKRVILPKNTIKIGAYAFYGGTQASTAWTALEEVFIPNTVTTIGKYAFFHCIDVTKLTFEEGINLETIEESTFSNLISLESLTIPDSVKTINKSAFSYLPIKDLVIPASVQSIPGTNSSAFYGGEFETLTFEEGSKLTTIGSMAFNSCNNLKAVSLPASLTELLSSCFANCRALESVTFETNEDGYMNLKKLESGAFQNCVSLKEICFPESTSSLTLGNNSFQNCYDLEKVTLNGQITAVNQVFTSCPSLKQFVVSETNEVLSVDEEAMILLSGGKNIEFVYGHVKNTADRLDFDTYTLERGVLMIKDGVEEINTRAFSQQTDIREVYIPASVKAIGDSAFFNCVNLKKVVFLKTDADSAFTTIGQHAFKSCQKLTSINLPTTTKTIGAQAFRYCYSLKEITLPASLNYDGANNNTYIFGDCYALETVTFEENAVIEFLKPYMFQNCYALKNITIPESVKGLGIENAKEATYYNGYVFNNCTSLESIHLPSQVKEINSFNFSGCTSLTTITAGGTITKIANSAFLNCVNLTELGFNTQNVTRVGSNVFQGCTALTGIELPSATEVKNYAFDGCTALTSINLPKVTSLGTYVFRGCTNLSSANINSALTKIDTNTFQNCTSLKEFTFPSKLTSVGNYAFQGSGLENVVLPETLKGTNLGTYAFADCANLKTIKLPSGLTRINNNTFTNCTSLASIELPAGLNTFQQKIFEGCTALKSITIPKLTTCGANSFLNCTALEEVTLTEGTKLGANMFEGCTALKSIVLPTINTPTITYLFKNCTALESVTLPSSFTKIPNYTFQGCTSLKTVICEGNITEIGISAFQGCTSLKDYVVPETVTKIADDAFNGCTALENVTLPAKLTSIGHRAFYDCANLTELELHRGLTTIGSLAFAHSGLTELVIPNTVTSASGAAFNACESLTSLVFSNDYYRNENGVIYNENNEVVSVLNTAQFENGTLVVAEGYTLLKNALFDCTSVKKVVLPTSMVNEDGTITTALFQSSNYLEEVVLPEGLTTLSNNMFYDAIALKKIVFPSTLTTINQYAFKNCTSLETLELPSSLTTLMDRAFQESCIKTLVIPASVENLGEYTFYNCASLEEVIFEENSKATRIGKAMFLNSSLQKIVLPDSITVIADEVFSGCANLTEITLPAKLEYLGNKAFYNSGIKSIFIPNTLKEWGSYKTDGSFLSAASVFEGCVNLETAVFEEGLVDFGTSYGSSMFKNCTALKSVKLSSTFETLPYEMFRGCTALMEIYVPEKCIVGTSSFKGWTAEQKIYTSLSLREVMLTWAESWNTKANTEATLVTDYVPANA